LKDLSFISKPYRWTEFDKNVRALTVERKPLGSAPVLALMTAADRLCSR
jgi:hypothetical protein